MTPLLWLLISTFITGNNVKKIRIAKNNHQVNGNTLGFVFMGKIFEGVDGILGVSHIKLII